MQVDGKDITKYLKDEGYDVEWYDLSLDSTRNAKGNLQYNPVNQKYKVILHTRYLTQEELVDFCSIISNLKTYTVRFLNPFTGSYLTINAYRGDRKITMKWNRTDRGILYLPMDMSLIEL